MRTRIIALVFVSLAAASAIAQQNIIVPEFRQYAAKFVCGKASDSQISRFDFAPGSYYTVINVHEPHTRVAMEFRKKFALAERDEQGGKISEWFPAALKPDQAMQINCGSIYKHLGIPVGTFIDGFAVIQYPSTMPPLDVVGVYTVSPGNGVSSIHIERVDGRITQ